MTSVRFFPVALQYPSSTATSSALASQRISGMETHKKNPPPQGDRAAGAKDHGPPEKGVRAVAEEKLMRSGRLALGLLGLKDLRPKQLEEHETGVRYAGCAPFGHGTRLDFAQFSDLVGAPEGIDDAVGFECFFVHAYHYKACLTPVQAIS